MEKFAGYGFNKSHSAAYALLSYQTAWLKAHYPAAFMSAVLSSDMDKTDKVVTLIDEARRMQLKVEPPDVNTSHYMFTVSAASAAFATASARSKASGKAVVEMLVAEREANGAFRDLADLCRRSDQNRMNRRVLEALIRSGALDALGANRATLMHALPAAMQLADQTIRARVVGQNDMFGLMDHGGRGADGHAQQRSAAGLEPPRATRRRARHARAVSHRSSVRGVRARGAADHQRPHRRHHRRPPAAEQRRLPAVPAASRRRSRAWCSISASAAAA